MNKKRKQKIRDVRKEIEKCKDDLQKILDEEQDYFDNMPENLQGSMRGSDSENAIDTMESCVDDLENIIKELMEIQEVYVNGAEERLCYKEKRKDGSLSVLEFRRYQMKSKITSTICQRIYKVL